MKRSLNNEKISIHRFIGWSFQKLNMVKFEKKWAVVGMTICILLNFLSAIGVIPIEGLERGKWITINKELVKVWTVPATAEYFLSFRFNKKGVIYIDDVRIFEPE